MTIKNLKSFFANSLQCTYDQAEIGSMFYIILEKIHNLKRIDLALITDFELHKIHFSEWNLIIEKLIKYQPLQYILGSSPFFGLEFIVNPAVLIPRPETEELVDWVLKAHQNQPDLKILDIGTGSGCIAISLAKNLKNANVVALDISNEALKVAQQNAINNEVLVKFINADILNISTLDENFDIIISNPPYVRDSEKLEMQRNVMEYEPHLALFVSQNQSLIFYEKIAALAQNHLKKNGFLYFEINQYLAQENITMLQNLNFKSIELRQDVHANDRMIRAQLKS